jgi:hypothetical protein
MTSLIAGLKSAMMSPPSETELMANSSHPAPSGGSRLD